ncbi:Crp/Fnr family transcriptional regulator [Bradyrhizobium uaiense]|uniref:Crp/Fnr family transcriptional regulator n=1 Tax=Bradyrhizobium uaiense TaxID=2594946 RepID=UPI001F334A42|nr:cyclic nucleotide-binding domain-containing protein [Bradyrhizobium uaiense]
MPIDMMIRKVRLHTGLTEEDTAALRSIVSSVRDLGAGTSIMQEGEISRHCCVMLSGFSYRAKVSDGGKRQILSFHIAGDMPDLHGMFLKRMDHDLTTLTQARVGFIDHRALRQVISLRPAVAEALWRETLIDAVLFREWIVSLGTVPLQRAWPIWWRSCVSAWPRSTWSLRTSSGFPSLRQNLRKRLD